jgi:hypothetical protein
MSLFSSIILPKLEAELIAHEPAIADFLVKQFHNIAKEIVVWAESKISDHGVENEVSER